MTTVKQATENRQFIPANEFFALLRTNQDFSDWMCRRINELDMELNHDFYIFLDMEAARELSKIETFHDKSAHKLLNSILKENE
jgi:phage anti-repressor protein